MEDILKLIGNYGFPVVLSSYLLIRMEKTIQGMEATIQMLDHSIKLLTMVVNEHVNEHIELEKSNINRRLELQQMAQQK